MEPASHTFADDALTDDARARLFPNASKRAFAALACFIAGILLARAVLTSDSSAVPALAYRAELWLALTFVFLALGAFARGAVCAASLAIGVAMLGTGITIARTGAWPAHSVAHQLAPTDANNHDHAELVDLSGIVMSPVRVHDNENNLFRHTGTTTISFVLRVVKSAHAPNERTTGSVRVRVNLAAPPSQTPEIPAYLHVGSRVRVEGIASPVRPPMNPGERDWRPMLRQRGIAGTVRVPDSALVTRDPALIVPASVQLHATWISFRDSVQRRAKGLFDGAIEYQADATDEANGAAVLLRALVLGQRDDQDTQQLFARAGVAHMLAISGFHLAVLAWLVRGVVRLAGDWGRLEPIIATVMVLVYLALVPANPPIVRAAILVLAVMGAEALGRRYEPIAMLAWTAFVLLLFRPMDVFSMGFQLTFVLVAALMLLGPATMRRAAHNRVVGSRSDTATLQRSGQQSPGIVRWGISQVLGLAMVSVVCWCIATPIVMYHVGLASPIGVITSVLVYPCVVVVLGLGAMMMIAASMSSAISAFIGMLVLPPASLAVYIVSFLDSLPGSSVRVPAISLAWTVAVVLFAFVWFLRKPTTNIRISMLCIVALACLLGWLGLEIRSAQSINNNTVLRVDTLSIGNGTCSVVRSGSDAMLWDCGSLEYDIGLRTVPDAVRAIGAWRIPTAIVTHPNTDHYSGLMHAADAIGLKRVLVTQRMIDQQLARPEGPAAAMLETLKNKGVDVVLIGRGDTIPLGNTTMTILWPPKDAERSRRFMFDNDTSVVALIEPNDPELQARRVLFTGDIQRAGMASILELEPDLRADVLELPHHGSYSDSAHEFVGTINPSLVLQSTGVQRLDDPRWDRARERRAWFATPRTGWIRTELRRDGRWHTKTYR